MLTVKVRVQEYELKNSEVSVEIVRLHPWPYVRVQNIASSLISSVGYGFLELVLQYSDCAFVQRTSFRMTSFGFRRTAASGCHLICRVTR